MEILAFSPLLEESPEEPLLDESDFEDVPDSPEPEFLLESAFVLSAFDVRGSLPRESVLYQPEL